MNRLKQVFKKLGLIEITLFGFVIGLFLAWLIRLAHMVVEFAKG